VGVGPYRFGETKLVDAQKAGRCVPLGDEPDVVQCLGMPSAGLGGEQKIFFSKKTGLLAEIEISLDRCDPIAVTQNLERLIHDADAKEDGGRRVYWNLDRMFVAARLPMPHSEGCLINFVAGSDTARIASLKSGQ
jgi:hypothetical protein